jgi:PAS domain S-box-containing protein
MKITTSTGSKESVWLSAELNLLSGKVWTGEVEYTRADGTMVIAELILSPVLDSNGMLSECIALLNDLAGQKDFARKMTDIQSQYRGIVESSLDGIMVVQNERLVYVNPSAVNTFGYASAEEMRLLNFSETVAPLSKPFLTMTSDGRVLGDEVFRNYELRGLTKQGKIIDLEANALVIAWNDYPAVQASFRNITKRKTLEREQMLWLWEQETLSAIDRKLIGVVDLNKIFAAILQQSLNLTRAHFSGVLLYDEATMTMQWNSICGNMLQHTADVFRPNETLCDILKNKEPLVIQDSGSETIDGVASINRRRKA